MSSHKPNKKWKLFNFDAPMEKLSTGETIQVNDEFIDAKPPVKSINFEERLTPKLVEDLAVHSRKIKDVEIWLQNNVLSPKRKPNSSILLLTGPTGCGKTSTVKVLCRTMNVEISEWVNPIDADFESFRGPGQTNLLKEFLVESKFPSLLSTNPKVTLIEDFPNSVVHNPCEFVEILEQCYDAANTVIFICTDASSKNLNLPQTLFPQEIKDKFSITNISFNPCSATLMKDMLKKAQRFVTQNSDVMKIPNETTIESIVSSAMGDIRSAINQFYFACLKGSAELPSVFVKNDAKPGAKRKRNSKMVKNMVKDESLGLFHSLGRVLNPKRRDAGKSWRLHCNLDSLIDELSTQPSTFAAFLHENYLKYFGDLNDVCNASEILSSSQVLLSNWMDKGDGLMFGLWLTVLGLMVCNEHKVSKWTQISGPTRIIKKVSDDLEMKRLPIVDRSYYNLITRSNKYDVLKFS